MSVAAGQGMTTKILDAVDEVNNRQKKVLFEKIKKHFGGSVKGRKIALWGLAFKPRTDDIREAPSLVLIDDLLAAGAAVSVHDPVAQDHVRDLYGDKLTYCDHHYDTLKEADALAIVTEWNEFRNPDLSFIKHLMKSPVIFDGRNLFDPTRLRNEGFTYLGIGL